MSSSRLLRASAIAALAFVAACDRKAPPAPQTQPQPSGDVETITGAERIGWDQPAVDRSDLATFRFAIYVDGSRSELTSVSCADTPGANGFACDSSLPPLTRGAHTLEIAAFVQDGTDVAESSRSPALRVNIVAATAGAASAFILSDPQTANPLGLRVERISDGLRDPADAGFTPDGRLFVIERAGRMRVLRRDGRLSDRDGLRLDDLSTAGEGGALALAIDPQFERTHFVYVVYTAAARSGTSVFRLARFREVDEVLGERAILLDGVAAAPAHPSATLRFGPDGKLYAAFDDGGDPRRIGDLSSYSGKILRLNPDGSSPADQPGDTPFYAEGDASPRALAWRAGPGTLWIAGGGRLRAVDRPQAGSIAHARATGAIVPILENVWAMTFYHDERIAALRDNLLVAARDRPGLLRIRLDDANPARIATADPLIDTPAIVHAIAVGPDGAIYTCSSGAIDKITQPR